MSWAIWTANYYDIIVLWCNVTSWHHIHGDWCLQTPIISDYEFNFVNGQVCGKQSHNQAPEKLVKTTNFINIMKNVWKNIMKILRKYYDKVYLLEKYALHWGRYTFNSLTIHCTCILETTCLKKYKENKENRNLLRWCNLPPLSRLGKNIVLIPVF